MNPFGARPSLPYTVHKWALGVGVALWLMGVIAGKVLIIAGGGVALIVAGVAAVLGARSVISGITVGGSVRSWSEQELAEMRPCARLAHALLTGGVLVLLGLWGVGLAGMSLRSDWLRAQQAKLENARGSGTWKPDAPKAPLTFGSHGWYEALAIGGDRICYTSSGVGIVSAALHCRPQPQSLGLGGQAVRRLRFAGEHLLWAADASVGFVNATNGLVSARRFQAHGLPRTLAGTQRWVAWDEGSAIIVGRLEDGERRRLDHAVPAEGRVVMAAQGERLLFGPTRACSLQAIDLENQQQHCLIRGARRPVAVDTVAQTVAVALEDGELFSVTPVGPQGWGKVTNTLAVSMIDATLFVVASDAVYRLRAPGATPEPLSAHVLEECEAAGRFGDFFAWQFGNEVRIVLRHAAPLEPFERR